MVGREPLHVAREMLWRELSREKNLNSIRVRMPPALVQEQKMMIKNIHRVLREESSTEVVIKWTMILIENQGAYRTWVDWTQAWGFVATQHCHGGLNIDDVHFDERSSEEESASESEPNEVEEDVDQEQ